MLPTQWEPRTHTVTWGATGTDPRRWLTRRSCSRNVGIMQSRLLEPFLSHFNATNYSSGFSGAVKIATYYWSFDGRKMASEEGGIARSHSMKITDMEGGLCRGEKGLPVYQPSFVRSAVSSGALATTGSGWETLLSFGLQTFRTAAPHPYPGLSALSYWATPLPAISWRPPLVFDLCNEEENSSPANSAQELWRN